MRTLRPLWLLSLGWVLIVLACVLLMGELPLHAGPKVRYHATEGLVVVASALFIMSLVSSMYRQDWKKHPAAFLAVLLLNSIPLAAVALFIWLCFNLAI